MTRGGVVLAGALAIGAAPAGVVAQARTLVTPSVSVGAVYDENVLWDADAQSDHVWRVEPRIDLLTDTVRSRLWLESAWSSEWYSRHRDLSSFVARQRTASDWSWEVTPVSSVAATAVFDNTTDPTHVNPATGLGLGRTRTWHASAAPNYTHALTPRLSATVRYRASAEFASVVDDVFSQSFESDLSWNLQPRNELRAGYGADRFVIGETAFWSHRPAVHWVHRLTPLVRVMAGGGARLTGRRVQPAIDLAISRQAGETEAALSYNWSQATSLGVAELIDVQRVVATVHHGVPGRTVASAHAGIYRNAIAGGHVDVYRAGVALTQPLWGAVAVALSGTIDYQRNAPGFGIDGGVPFPGDTRDHLRRSVFAIRVVVSGPHYASMARREEPADLVRDPHRGAQP